MHPSAKKFFLVLLIAIAIGVAILIAEVKQFRTITTRSDTSAIIAEQPIDIPLYTTDPVFGNPGADLVIIEFIDMANPTSRSFHEMMYSFATQNPTKVRLVWKDLPQKHVFSGDSTNAHVAAACANKQGKFWPFVHAVFTTKNNLSDTALAGIAQTVGMNMPQWNTCLASTQARQSIVNNAVIAPTIGVGSAPAIFINSKRLDTDKNIDYPQLLNTLISQ